MALGVRSRCATGQRVHGSVRARATPRCAARVVPTPQSPPTIVRLLCILLCSWPSLAFAERYALAIGNNLGDSDEETLRWAEDDARRTKDLLIELGDVQAEHARLLIGAN